MPNVFEGAPDSRQTDTATTPMTRFRPRYRALSDQEKALHDDIKDAFVTVENLIERLSPGRYKALALTSLEESCMWAIKQLTAN